MIEYGNQHLNINGGSDRAEGLQEAPEPSSVQQSWPLYWKDIYRTSTSRLTVRPSVENVSHTFYQLIWHRYSPLYWTQSHLDRVQSNSVVLIQTTRPKRSFNPKSVSIGEAMSRCLIRGAQSEHCVWKQIYHWCECICTGSMTLPFDESVGTNVCIECFRDDVFL